MVGSSEPVVIPDCASRHPGGYPSAPTYMEALELQEIQTREDDEQLNYSSASASSGEEYRVTTRTVSRSSAQRPPPDRKGAWKVVHRFWTHHVAIIVPQKSNRDHLALERTFLAYMRTSVVIAMQGVLISQLFRLQRPQSTHHPRLRFYDVGVPLAVACHLVAIIVACIGAFRFWRQQSAISRGKVHAGGWELNSVGILLALLILVTLILSVVILVEIDLYPSSLFRLMV
ncbi:Uncharacterized protein PECH_000240 [Penicillium ucsense]|uniref:DUF202 domain-containing protein n=1 Tax=Penicillium ucsense TaxID=2839758 RepID=A0A8J8WJH5_9EURO|nr:Uncharacterized protein PECM_008567 [Penicillium ucsense]KAF7738521.1 Uncharacterized protein PECH_000240 [Penicillium ucsense]